MVAQNSDTVQQKKELKQAFLETWPLDRVEKMELEDYTNLKREDSFCYWVERKTQGIGSIQGATSFKFGIFKRDDTDKEYTANRFETDGEYAWENRYGNTREEAFQKVKQLVLSVIEHAQVNNLEAIDEIDMSNMFKWKIAFLYSDYQVVNIFKKSAIKEVARKMGLANADEKEISQLHRFLMDQKPSDIGYFEYAGQLWESYNESRVDEEENEYTANKSDKRYWLYAPGSGAEYWDEFYESGIMAIGWDFLGDLSEYNSEKEIQRLLQKQFETESSKKNDKRACWDFANEIRKGDIIIAKKGTTAYLGWGIVTSGYIYDDTRAEFKNVRRVDWKKRGVWEDKDIVRKALTDISDYTDYIEKLGKKLSINEEQLIMSSNNMLNLSSGSVNTILFGPPGTGKTYHTVDYALSIVDPEFYKEHSDDRQKLVRRFRELLITDWDNPKQGRIAATTFHQSFTYEDFIEGIKPELTSNKDEDKSEDGQEFTEQEEEKKSIRYTIEDGIFKRISNLARQESGGAVEETKGKLKWDLEQFNKAEFYKLSLGDVNIPEDEEIYKHCIRENKIAIGFLNETDLSNKDEAEIRAMSKDDPELDDHDCRSMAMFKSNLKTGYYVVIPYGNHKFRAIGRITGEYSYNPDAPIRYHHFRDVEWLVTDLDLPVDLIYNKNFMQQTIYHLRKKDVKPEFFIRTKASQEDGKSYVLIIDEINRGNIAQIFGELITLIEEDKREGLQEQMEVSLPYSKKPFSVPSNLHLIGTMNTADRSVEALDTALRRRFQFEEVPPNPNIIAREGKADNGVIEVNGDAVALTDLLNTMNQRIEKILDKDHLIGHSYFMGVENWKDLQTVFRQNVIPLLEEYFFGDKGKIQLVLGKGFIEVDNDRDSNKNLFPSNAYDGQAILEDRPVWKIKSDWKQGEAEFVEALALLDIQN